ncbi:response regulator [Lachnospiraceae bacterium Marseille-Q4251]|nr:response regulator [Lachnospiraceae bacterium Marseille-Q4251]
MLYRILLVDDEELITDSLAGMLAEAPQYELDVYKAYSGSEALELLNEQQFDIVVSDICMPGISGIGLAQKIREKWPLCHVIFQTGYDDFQYAQQAIRQRVTHYILKSEGDEVLLAAIGECIRRLEEDARKQADLIRVQEENRVYKAMIRRKQIQNLFRFDQEKEENFSIDLKKPVFLLAGRSSEKMEEAVGLAVDEVLKEKIAYAVRSEMAWLDKKVIIWVLQQEEKEDLPYAAAVVKGMAEGFCHVLRYRFGIAFSFVFQEKEIEWSQVAEELERLRQIATNRLNPDKQLVMAGVEYFEDAEESEKSFVNRLMNYMWENIDGDLSLCTLSDKLHLNPSYLSRRFKSLTGKNLTEAILELRVKKACELLKNTSLKISEIAPMVGYETAANFSKVFKKMMNITPREYRDGEGILK